MADEPGDECLKRVYNCEDYNKKLERLAAYYKLQLIKPKVYIQEFVRPLRHYYYYTEKKKQAQGNKVGAIFSEHSGSNTPVTQR